jgi:hypothetical protein
MTARTTEEDIDALIRKFCATTHYTSCYCVPIVGGYAIIVEENEVYVRKRPIMDEGVLCNYWERVTYNPRKTLQRESRGILSLT